MAIIDGDNTEYGWTILPGDEIRQLNEDEESFDLSYISMWPHQIPGHSYGSHANDALGVANSSVRENWADVLFDFNEYLGSNADYSTVMDMPADFDELPSPDRTLKERAEQILRGYRDTYRAFDGPDDDVLSTQLVATTRWPFGAADVKAKFIGTKEGTQANSRFAFVDHDDRLDKWSAFHVFTRLMAMHSALFGVVMNTNLPQGNLLIRTPYVPGAAGKLRPNASVADAVAMFNNIKLGIPLLKSLLTSAPPVEGTEFGGFTASSLTESQKASVIGNADYNQLFTTAFDANTIALIPIIYNFYLTTEYFQGMSQAFDNPKDRVVDIILSTIANDGNFDSTPDLSRPAAEAAIADSTGQDQLSAFNSASRDFILKMLIKTPIDILKGLTELIDPHIVISKLIRTGTGFAFNAAALAMDPVTSQLNQQIASATDGQVEPSLSGEDLLSLLLCLVDNAMKGELDGGGEDSPTNPMPDGPDGNPLPSPADNFFPRISIDGIDFAGTVSGMLMMPPSPLGLIYLLLELLKNDVTNQTQNVVDANTENAAADQCSDTIETTEDGDPCDDPSE